MKKNIAIVGAGGRMGSWFQKYFSKVPQSTISIYDQNLDSIKHRINVSIFDNVYDCVRNADIVFISVPVRDTPSTIIKCASVMKSNSILIEISSVKRRSYKAMQKVPVGIQTLCIHPMFGPGAKSLKDMKILIIPIRNIKSESRKCKNIFRECDLIRIKDAQQHDRSIAIILGLTHFVNASFAEIVSHEDMQALKKISGTTFQIQSLLCESIFNDEPELLATLIAGNPAASTYINRYLENARKIYSLTKTGNNKLVKSSLAKTKSRLQKQEDLQRSYIKMYGFIELLKDQQHS